MPRQQAAFASVKTATVFPLAESFAHNNEKTGMKKKKKTEKEAPAFAESFSIFQGKKLFRNFFTTRESIPSKTKKQNDLTKWLRHRLRFLFQLAQCSGMRGTLHL